MAASLAVQTTNDKQQSKIRELNNLRFLAIIFVLCSLFYVLFSISRYWYADVLYAKGKTLNDQANYAGARVALFRAAKMSPWQPVYFEELSQSAAGLALASFDAGDKKSAELFAETAITEINRALELSPANLNFLKSKSGLFIKLSVLDAKLLNITAETLERAINLSPTDAKLYYNLGLTHVRINQIDKALVALTKAVELKSNYKDARFALGFLYAQNREFAKAREQYLYILEKISPDDLRVKQQLEEIKGN